MKKHYIDRDSRLAALSMAFLVVGIIGVYGYYSNVNLQINADQVDYSTTTETPTELTVILKLGINELSATSPISLVTPLIAIDGKLISIKEANQLGIVSTANDSNDKNLLENEIDVLQAGEKFTLQISDITGSPMALIR